MPIRRLNHAVLYVRDAKRSVAFYTDVLGFEVRASLGDQAFFLRADGSTNDHDLGLFQVETDRVPPTRSASTTSLGRCTRWRSWPQSAPACWRWARWSARATTA